MSGGGGGGSPETTPQAVIALCSAYNPDYGKMAAEGIASEVKERGLLAATIRQSAPVASEVSTGGSPAAQESAYECALVSLRKRAPRTCNKD